MRLAVFKFRNRRCGHLFHQRLAAWVGDQAVPFFISFDFPQNDRRHKILFLGRQSADACEGFIEERCHA